jgi:hypothetical protein
MCCIDGQENKYSVLNECSRMLKYNIVSDLRVPMVGTVMNLRFNERRGISSVDERLLFSQDVVCCLLLAR